MIKKTYTKRVRYAETDRMGFMYYGHYAQLYEIGRAELIRELGFTYKDLEDIHGVMLPVLRLECKYHYPALYDQPLRIETYLRDLPTRMITFEHKIFNDENDQLLNEGMVKLLFVDMKSNRTISCPDVFRKKFEEFF